MKKSYLLLILIIWSIRANAQVSDSTFFNRLYYTCKVWGHAKYYHTRIASGEVDWDNVLLASVNGIKTAPDNIAFNDSLLVMLNSAGEMGSGSNLLPEVPDSLNNNDDLNWIHDSIFSDNVETILENIRVKFRPQNNIYVGKVRTIVPSFENDNNYFYSEDFPDEGKRILAIFRYWNIIHYFFPYKYLMDQDWDISLKQFIPKIVRAHDALSYHLAFKEFTVKINDSHGFFSSPTYSSWNGNEYTPFLARFIENEMVITKVLPGIPLAQGDIIKKMDGKNIYDLRDSLRIYAHGSNNVNIERSINNLILFGQNGSFSITVSDGNNEKTVTLNRNSTNANDLIADYGHTIEVSNANEGCYYIIVDMGKLTIWEVWDMFRVYGDRDAIIFDLRNYPQGTLFGIINYLYQSSIHIAKFTVPDITYPGRLYWKEEHIGTGTSTPYRGKLIILMDEGTISQAEYTCMGLEQFPFSLKIGSTTAGADGDIAPVFLPGNITTHATFLGVYYPDYTCTQRVGIIPDIVVLPTIHGIRNGKDEVLDYALNCELFSNKEQIHENESIRLYPNPVKDYLYYEVSSARPVLLEIYDVVGLKCKIIGPIEPEGSIDISGLTSGIYTVKIVMKDNIHTIKIIKY